MGRGQPTRLFGLLLIVSLIGASCGGNATPKASTSPSTTNENPVTLTMWRVFDDPQIFDPIIEKYQETHPNVSLQVIEKDYPTYELDVANAIAAGNPPDLWMIRNDWLPKHADKLHPMPEGTLAGTATNKKKTGSSNIDILRTRYPAVVETDAVLNSKPYGIPLTIDTLALYYNKDHFAEAGIAEPPATWGQFVKAVEKLTQYDDQNHTKIRRPGAALGTGSNVNRASDILMLLMLQNRTTMASDDKTSVLFNGSTTRQGGGLIYPGTTALEFYTGFADPDKTVYTWNHDFENSVDEFIAGRVSMIFSYAYLQRLILQKNPTLNVGIAPMVQVDNDPDPVDYPTYWLEVVSRNSKHTDVAWDFLRFMSEEGDLLYQEATDRPPAKKVDDAPESGERLALMSQPGAPWTFQATTAQSWFRGKNPGKIEQIFVDMIENVVTFVQPPQVAIDNAATQATKVFEKPNTILPSPAYSQSGTPVL